MTIRLGIIGWPLTKTFSPNIHQSLSEISNIDIAYKKLPIENFTLDIYESLNNEFDGYNVTIPHKNSISSYLDHITNDAHNITAVNCVHNNKGYNTDWIGFIHALNQNQIEVKDKSCLIIGSGGAAYAIAYALIKCEVSSISIKNRNRKNKLKLEEWVKNRFIQKTDLNPEIIINCSKRIVVPEFPQSNSLYGDINVSPKIIFSLFSVSFIDMLQFFRHFSVDLTSWPVDKFIIFDFSCEREAISLSFINLFSRVSTFAFK